MQPKQSDTRKISRWKISRSESILATIGLLLVVGLLDAAPASAGFEQVAATHSAGGDLINSTGMAVNTSGAGGVPAGTVYAVANGNTGDRPRVTLYSAKGDFLQAWGWAVAEPPAEEFQRCGPDGEAAHPICKSNGGVVGEGVGQFNSLQGIAVDQATGNVYVLNAQRKHGVVQVFNADGSHLISSFGELGTLSEPVGTSPEKIHAVRYSGIAVNGSGVVFISDSQGLGGEGSRVMVFEPEGLEDYVYSGQPNDIAASQGSVRYGPRSLALDSAGNLYTAREESIYEFAPGNPTTPVCEFQLAIGGIEGMTVNPETGEVFYFTYKNKKIHQITCGALGKFEETASFTVTPKTEYVYGLAFNRDLAYEASRPAGVLYAADGLEHSSTERGLVDIFAPAEVHSPSIESESVITGGIFSTTLGAQINPHGSETRYFFEYLTEGDYQANDPTERFSGASEAPLGGAVLGSGLEALSATVAIVGLQPDAAYRYRVIATSHCNPDDEAEVCEGAGLAETFHTFPAEAPNLPDNRAYELVSPALKNGSEVFPADPRRGRCGGECKPGVGAPPFPKQSSPDGEAVVYEGFPFSLTEGAPVFNEYLSKRTSSGWQTTILAPALMGTNSQGYKAFNAELTQGVLYQFDPPSLSPDAPSEFANIYTQPSADPSALTPLVETEPSNRLPVGSGRFELTYAGASADFSHLFFAANDALTGETPFAPEAVDGGASKNNLYEWFDGELRLVNVLPGNAEAPAGPAFGTGSAHAISSDGSRVFWSSAAGQVYVRVNGETTEAIPDPGEFLSASVDGSKVLFSNGHIYDLETEAIVDLSEGNGGFEGILGQSEDLSHVYFVDTAVLTGEEENDQGAKAQPGKNNLYAWHEGASTFVTTLASSEPTTPNSGILPSDNATGEAGFGDWQFLPSHRTAEASPDGRWVAFLSRAPLTGYDNFGPTCFFTAEAKFISGPCFEAFLYDSDSGKLTCVSCNPSGAHPLGLAELGLFQNADGSLSQPRYLTDQGRLYFDSQDSLVPSDTNDGVEDVYQYEPQGVGSCKREDGCVNLISAGHEPVDSTFLAVDQTGRNVFFTTRDQLVLKDRDELVDLYVAREGGGIASETEVGRGECQGEACQPSIVPPNDPTPGSSTFEGAGNVDEKKAAKKHKKKHKHAKKHKRAHKRAAKHNRGGAR